MNDREEIAKQIEDTFDTVAKWFEALPDAEYETGPEGKWTAAEHLDHLIRSATPLIQALALPKFIPGLLFGKAKHESRDFDGVVAAYRATLDQGGKASGRFIPEKDTAFGREKKANALRLTGQKLAKITRSWNEKDLDIYQLPHPLIGKMTIREMLYFTIFHTGYHLQLLERDHPSYSSGNVGRTIRR